MLASLQRTVGHQCVKEQVRILRAESERNKNMRNDVRNDVRAEQKGFQKFIEDELVPHLLRSFRREMDASHQTLSTKAYEDAVDHTLRQVTELKDVFKGAFGGLIPWVA